jgi:hypothetical protein
LMIVSRHHHHPDQKKLDISTRLVFSLVTWMMALLFQWMDLFSTWQMSPSTSSSCTVKIWEITIKYKKQYYIMRPCIYLFFLGGWRDRDSKMNASSLINNRRVLSMYLYISSKAEQEGSCYYYPSLIIFNEVIVTVPSVLFCGVGDLIQVSTVSVSTIAM